MEGKYLRAQLDPQFNLRNNLTPTYETFLGKWIFALTSKNHNSQYNIKLELLRGSKKSKYQWLIIVIITKGF